MHNGFPQNSRMGFCGYFPSKVATIAHHRNSGLCRCRLCDEFLQAIRFGAGLGEAPIPSVRGLPAFQHHAEDPISIIATFVSAFGIFVINPGVKDRITWVAA